MEKNIHFETLYGTEAEVTIDSRVDKMTVTETPEGKKILDFSGWSLIDGKWERESIKDETNYNVAEAQFIPQDDGSEDPENKGGDISVIEKYKVAIFPNAIGRWFEGTVKYNDTFFEIDGRSPNKCWWGDSIKTLDARGKQIEIETTNYVVVNFTDGNSVLIYKDKSNTYKTIFIDSDLTDWGNWSPRF
ncbi:MAG: hypothetical protein IPG80_08780 [Anaerolineales bacterium]|uniref:hypothetical protein n=1 Tax=Candidatus Villigracilis vicinus TaxID=3140679 RepID=UPI0031369FA8|nr:hypothetical protein [Anaerolineales bacterium]